MRALKQWVATKELVRRISQLHGDRITCVDLSGVKSLSDESVRSVLECCVRLRSLSVRKTRIRGSGAAWHWLSPEQTGRPATLTALNLSHCTALRDNIVETVARSCHALRSLELAGCKRLTDASLRALSSPPPPWAGGRGGMVGAAGAEASEAATAAAAAEAAAAGAATLALAPGRRRSRGGEEKDEEEQAKRASATAPCGPRLTSLDVGNATAITAAAIDALLEHQDRLLVLNLGGCRIEDASMARLATKHRHCRIYRR